MSAWFKRHRIDWIAEMVAVYGFINRYHIVRKFGISVPQASIDLRDAMRENPDLMVYNRSAKRYEDPFASVVDLAPPAPIGEA